MMARRGASGLHPASGFATAPTGEIVVGGDDGDAAGCARWSRISRATSVFAAGVERGGGLVEQPDRAGDGDEAGEREAAGLALRQVAGVVVVEAAEADGFKAANPVPSVAFPLEGKVPEGRMSGVLGSDAARLLDRPPPPPRPLKGERDPTARRTSRPRI